MNTCTKLKKRKRISKKVNIKSVVKELLLSKSEDVAPFTPGAEILVYEATGKPNSPQNVMMTLMRNDDNKYYRNAEKYTCKRFPWYKKVQATSFFYLLDMMLIEVQNTMINIALNKI